MMWLRIEELEAEAQALRDELARHEACDHEWSFLLSWGLFALEEHCWRCGATRLVYLFPNDPH